MHQGYITRVIQSTLKMGMSIGNLTPVQSFLKPHWNYLLLFLIMKRFVKHTVSAQCTAEHFISVHCSIGHPVRVKYIKEHFAGGNFSVKHL